MFYRPRTSSMLGGNRRWGGEEGQAMYGNGMVSPDHPQAAHRRPHSLADDSDACTSSPEHMMLPEAPRHWRARRRMAHASDSLELPRDYLESPMQSPVHPLMGGGGDGRPPLAGSRPPSSTTTEDHELGSSSPEPHVGGGQGEAHLNHRTVLEARRNSSQSHEDWANYAAVRAINDAIRKGKRSSQQPPPPPDANGSPDKRHAAPLADLRQADASSISAPSSNPDGAPTFTPQDLVTPAISVASIFTLSLMLLLLLVVVVVVVICPWCCKKIPPVDAVASLDPANEESYMHRLDRLGVDCPSSSIRGLHLLQQQQQQATRKKGGPPVPRQGGPIRIGQVVKQDRPRVILSTQSDIADVTRGLTRDIVALAIKSGAARADCRTADDDAAAAAPPAAAGSKLGGPGAGRMVRASSERHLSLSSVRRSHSEKAESASNEADEGREGGEGHAGPSVEDGGSGGRSSEGRRIGRSKSHQSGSTERVSASAGPTVGEPNTRAGAPAAVGGLTLQSPSLPDQPLMPFSEWTIDFFELRIGVRVGIGSFGEVFRGIWRGTEVAIKVLLEQDLTSDNMDDLSNEISLLSRLRHPNVILFLGACLTPPHLSMVTEYMHMGSLYRLIHASGQGQKLSWRRRLKMLRDICRCHICRACPSLPASGCGRFWLVCDFGLSRVGVDSYVVGRAAAGTPEWMAPELLRNEPVNWQCDVFSLGVIMWELYTLKRPWEGLKPLQVVYAVAYERARLEVPPGLLGRLMSDCFAENPAERPSYEEILTRLHECEFLQT
eukprot:jgi/Mesen1/9326/ME000061S08770